MNGYALAGASVLGRDHAALRRNAQDAFTVGAAAGGVFGVVCDGCGEGRRSEVGAGLAAAILAGEIERLLDAGDPVENIPQQCVARLCEVFGELAGLSPRGDARAAFVCEHLLTTVVGFCARGDEGIAFWCGDGLVMIDDDLTVIDEENRPRYPAYAVLRPGAPPPELCTRRFSAGAVRRVAVATDGFDPELVPAAFGRRGHALKRWMNMCARAGSFRDDATIVTAEREAFPPV